MGRCKETGKVHVTVDLKYYRPTEVVSVSALAAGPHPATGWENINWLLQPGFPALPWALCRPSVRVPQTRARGIAFGVLFSPQNALPCKGKQGNTHPGKELVSEMEAQIKGGSHQGSGLMDG